MKRILTIFFLVLGMAIATQADSPIVKISGGGYLTADSVYFLGWGMVVQSDTAKPNISQMWADSVWEMVHAMIETTSAKIATATLADSCAKYDTVNAVTFTELRTEIKVGAEIFNKIDTTTAKIPTATLADTTVGGAARATKSADVETTGTDIAAALSHAYAADDDSYPGDSVSTLFGEIVTPWRDSIETKTVSIAYPNTLPQLIFGPDFPADAYPYGVTITKLIFSQSAAGSDTFVLYEYANDSTFTSVIDSVVTTARQHVETDIADGAIAAGASIWIKLANRELDGMKVTVVYYIKRD